MQQVRRNLYALLVGIDNYPNPNHNLQGCVNDITAVEEYLNERFDQQKYQLNLHILKDEQATRAAVIHGFRNHLLVAVAQGFERGRRCREASERNVAWAIS